MLLAVMPELRNNGCGGGGNDGYDALELMDDGVVRLRLLVLVLVLVLMLVLVLEGLLGFIIYILNIIYGVLNINVLSFVTSKCVK